MKFRVLPIGGLDPKWTSWGMTVTGAAAVAVPFDLVGGADLQVNQVVIILQKLHSHGSGS